MSSDEYDEVMSVASTYVDQTMSHPASPSSDTDAPFLDLMKPVQTDYNSLGHRLWSIRHIRTAILTEFNKNELLQYLTLNRSTFEDVTHAIYRTVQFAEYLQWSVSPWTPTYRLDLYHQTVRHIELDGSLPACVSFLGGIPRLFKVFPNLQIVSWGDSTFTRFSVDGEHCNELRIESDIFAGSGKSARLARYKHHLPVEWNVVVKFDLTIRIADRFAKSMKPHKTIRPILLRNINSWTIERYGCTCSYCGGCGSDCDSCLPTVTQLFAPLSRLYEARSDHPILTPPIKTLVIAPHHRSLTLEELCLLSFPLGPSVEHLTTAVTITFSAEDKSWAFPPKVPPHTLGDILATFDWSPFTALCTLKLFVLIRTDNWDSVKWLCHPSSHITESNSNVPPPMYPGPPLNLERFDLEFVINPMTAVEYPNNAHWVVDALPDPDTVIRQAVALSGPTCNTTVTWSPLHGELDDDGDQDEQHDARMIYNYLLVKLLQRARAAANTSQ